MPVHIGSVIKAYCKEHRITVTALCRKLGMDNSAVYRIFMRPHLNTETILKISAALRHNFFECYCDRNVTGTETELKNLNKDLVDARQEIEELKRQLEIVKRENELLNKFLDKMKPS